MRLKYKLLSAISEPFKIRNGWGLRIIRTKREYEALLEFCRRELKKEYEKNLAIEENKYRKRIFEFTLELDEFNELNVDDNYAYTVNKLTFDNGKQYFFPIDFIEDNISWYYGK